MMTICITEDVLVKNKNRWPNKKTSLFINIWRFIATGSRCVAYLCVKCIFFFLILQHIHVQVFHSFVIKYLKCLYSVCGEQRSCTLRLNPLKAGLWNIDRDSLCGKLPGIISATWYIFFKSMTVINIDTDNKNSTQSSRMTHRVLCVYAYFKICFHMQC